ncbi:MAG: TIGR03619 family F420-dependent LLM class oxidoreductase [Acidimicrobiia bacterium]
MIRVSLELNTRFVDLGDEFLTGPAVAEVASTLESHGFAACHVTDHPAPDAGWIDRGGHHAVEPTVALAFAAAATSTLRLLTYVYIAAYRNPLLAAKQVATLDLLSGGRLVLGVGAGYMKSEFAALGVDYGERNELLDETLDVLDRAWTTRPFAMVGRRFEARGADLRPAPASRPRPPVWMGGNSERAMRRAVERCEGWVPFDSTGIAPNTHTADISSIDDLARRVERCHALAAEIGRTRPLEVCFAPRGFLPTDFDAAAERAKLQALDKAGATWAPLGIAAPDRASMLVAIRRYADEVLDPLR